MEHQQRLARSTIQFRTGILPPFPGWQHPLISPAPKLSVQPTRRHSMQPILPRLPHLHSGYLSCLLLNIGSSHPSPSLNVMLSRSCFSISSSNAPCSLEQMAVNVFTADPSRGLYALLAKNNWCSMPGQSMDGIDVRPP